CPPATESRSASSPRRASSASRVPCSSESLPVERAVVVAPGPVPASSPTTSAPPSASAWAVTTPVRPAPTTTTSARSGAGPGAAGVALTVPPAAPVRPGCGVRCRTVQGCHGGRGLAAACVVAGPDSALAVTERSGYRALDKQQRRQHCTTGGPGHYT